MENEGQLEELKKYGYKVKIEDDWGCVITGVQSKLSGKTTQSIIYFTSFSRYDNEKGGHYYEFYDTQDDGNKIHTGMVEINEI